jgi:methyl-accepting chemotaxis protein
VLATEQGSKAVDVGIRQTEVAGESIQALTASVSEAAQAAVQIAASSQQQLVGVDQVASAMESIKQASTQNVASATQLESAARSLNDLGGRLKQIVERYKV